MILSKLYDISSLIVLTIFAMLCILGFILYVVSYLIYSILIWSFANVVTFLKKLRYILNIKLRCKPE